MTGAIPPVRPLTDLWEWQQTGNCRGMDEDVFFPPTGERGNARTLRERGAVAICASCPVKAACLEHALSVPEPFGVWGGKTETERSIMLRGKRIRRRAA